MRNSYGPRCNPWDLSRKEGVRPAGQISHPNRWTRFLGQWVTLGVTLGLLLLVCTGCQAGPLQQSSSSAQVQRIVSGNTLEVTLLGQLSNQAQINQAQLNPTQPNQPQLNQIPPNQIQSVRLIGLNAPTLPQDPWGEQARAYLEQRLAQQQVRLELDTQTYDRFQRLLAYVWVGNDLINEDLIAQGYALADSRLPNIRYETRFRRAQEAARLQGLGLWNPDFPMRVAPDEFRRSPP